MASKKSPKADSKSQVSPIDPSLYSLPGMQKRELPAIAKEFFARMAPLLTVPRTSRAMLAAFDGIDVKAEEVGRILRANPASEFLFMRAVQALAKREQAPELESAVVLMGMQNTRNFVLAVQLHRQVRGTLPEFDSEGKLKTKPADQLRYALKAEEGDEYADTAFSAGLLYDGMALAAGALCPDASAQKVALSFLDQTFAHGMACAKLGVALGKKLPEFSARKFAFSACLLHDLGKVAMAILDPGYVKFLETAEKSALPRPVRHHAELARFGVTHAMLSAWCLRHARLLGEIELALEFHHDPALLRSRSKPMHQLASVVSLATQMATATDPAAWKTPDLRELRIDAAVLPAIKSGGKA
ncbi:MAG TPA: HDOD domain-containing protein [Bdellovibrionota bacterium]|nr:HDOD domain-containing protein [Bdellovibrionota bacterium]